MGPLSRWIVQHPWLMVAAHVVVTAVLAFYAMRVRIDSSITNVLPDDDPQVEYYAGVRKTFGGDNVAVIGVRSDDLFSARTLQKLSRVTNDLDNIDGVERVLSITNAPDLAADATSPPRLLPGLAPGPDEVAAFKQKLSARPLYGKNLVSSDFRGAAINVFFKDMSDTDYRDKRIDERIATLLGSQGGPEEFMYTGVDHIQQAAVDLMRRDLWRFTPVALALIVIVLWISFRSTLGVLLPLLSVVMALVWTLGTMGLSGTPITLGTFILPALLLVVGSSYAIHVVSRYVQQVEAGVPPDRLVVRTLELVWVPLVISALTTQVGFGALMVNRITAIRDLGLFAVIGLGCTLVTSLSFLPAVLSLVNPRWVAVPIAGGSSRLGEFLARIGRSAYEKRRGILWSAMAVAVLALPGIRQIRVDSDFLAYFSPDSEIRRANETINRDIVGSSPFYLIVEGAPGQLKRWEVLHTVKGLQQFLASLPGITSSVSLVDWLEVFEAGLHPDESGDLVVDEAGNVKTEEAPKPFWEEPRNLDRVLEMVTTNPKTFSGFITSDFSTANILVRTRYTGSREIEALLDAIRDYVAQHFPADVRVQPTGSLVLLTGTSSDIVAGQIESLSIALGLIFLIFSVMFLSARVGFLAVVPNILPIILFFGTLGWMAVPLNQGTSLIAAIALGLVVDSTVHYMARLNLELKGETNQAEAITRTTGTVGVPITYATVALFFGFLTFAFSNFVPIQNFGTLTAMTMGTALLANLVLLPALLATTKIITLWDLVNVRLGKDPTRTIPLLRGLRPAQARIVVLMGEMKRFAPGQAIVRRGEQGNEMYLIIEGTTEVWAGSGAERKRLVVLKRGDVFGEMALVRQDVRSADVVATGPVEVLALDERFLSRIQARYPRIASKVLLNLTRLLSDTLQRTTDRYVGAVG